MMYTQILLYIFMCPCVLVYLDINAKIMKKWKYLKLPHTIRFLKKKFTLTGNCLGNHKKMKMGIFEVEVHLLQSNLCFTAMW